MTQLFFSVFAPGKSKCISHEGLHMNVLETLFIIAKNGNNPNVHPKKKDKHILVYSHKEYYPAI